MAGEMTQEQIKELRQQYEREYNNLEKAINEEKVKQLSNMRSAMLTAESRRSASGVSRQKRRRLPSAERSLPRCSPRWAALSER